MAEQSIERFISSCMKSAWKTTFPALAENAAKQEGAP